MPSPKNKEIRREIVGRILDLAECRSPDLLPELSFQPVWEPDIVDLETTLRNVMWVWSCEHKGRLFGVYGATVVNTSFVGTSVDITAKSTCQGFSSNRRILLLDPGQEIEISGTFSAPMADANTVTQLILNVEIL